VLSFTTLGWEIIKVLIALIAIAWNDEYWGKSREMKR